MRHGLPTAILASLAVCSTLPAAEPDAPASPRLATRVAFPNLKFDRPVAMAYPDDGSNLLFVVEQHRPRSGRSPTTGDDPDKNLFLELPDPINRGNEEGLLGLAFHPKFKENRQFFVYYSANDKGATALGRLAVPDVTRRRPPRRPGQRAADLGLGRGPLREPQRRHDRLRPGRLPLHHARRQRRRRRPAVDRPEPARLVRVDPADRRRSSRRRPGLRHPGGQPGAAGAASSPTGRPRCTASACGTSGSSASTARPATSGPATSARTSGRWSTASRTAATTAGASARAFHPFQPQRRQRPDAAGPIRPPIVEYPHAPTADRPDSGLSITGGYVYRGKKIPELVGVYVYGDYDSGRIWGLRYENGKLVANGELIEVKPEPEAEHRVVRRGRRRASCTSWRSTAGSTSWSAGR